VRDGDYIGSIDLIALGPRRLRDIAKPVEMFQVLAGGEQVFESLARKGAAMTTAEMTNYAYGQIDQARAELNAVPK
jgi:hypothetical protein